MMDGKRMEYIRRLNDSQLSPPSSASRSKRSLGLPDARLLALSSASPMTGTWIPHRSALIRFRVRTDPDVEVAGRPYDAVRRQGIGANDKELSPCP